MPDPKMSANFFTRLVSAAVFFCFASTIWASSIVYTFSGTASGTLGGTTFTNALVQETAVGDTAGVVSFTADGINLFANPVDITIAIAGVGTTTVTQPSALYSIPSPFVVGDGFPDVPYAILATIDNPPSLDSFTGLGVLGSNALLGYDLATSFGPVTGTPGGIGYAPRGTIDTSSGDLAFNSNIVPTGTGTFAATVATPEPGSFLMLSAGLVLVMRRFRRANGSH
jgi:hypothetical protein